MQTKLPTQVKDIENKKKKIIHMTQVIIYLITNKSDCEIQITMRALEKGTAHTKNYYLHTKTENQCLKPLYLQVIFV